MEAISRMEKEIWRMEFRMCKRNYVIIYTKIFVDRKLFKLISPPCKNGYF